MMRLHNTYIKTIAASLMCGLLICSCKKDEMISASEESAVESDIVSFDISASGSWTPDVIGDADQTPTRSGITYSDPLPMDCEGDGESLPEEICIYMIEEDNPDQPKDAMPLTKAGGDEQTETLYGIYAYLGKGSAAQPSYEGVTTFMNNLELFSDGKYSGEDKYWPGNGWWLEFFAYSPYLTNNSQSASYIEDCITYPAIHHIVSANLADHVDIMAGKSDKIDGSVTATVGMEVSHILSKVQVKVGTVSCGQITSLKISGVNDSGVYSLAGLSWSNQGVSSGTIADVAYTQTFTEPQQNNTLLGQPMYMIPQQMPESAKIEVEVKATIKDEDKNFTLSKNLKDFFIEGWKQDKQYTIVISTPHEVEVEVTDNVEYEGDYPVKKNLVIKNSGLTEAYIRVTVSGAWMVDDNTSGTEKKLTVAEWKETDGEYTWPSAGKPTTDTKNSNNWRLGPDGYYYYMMKTSPGQVLGTLFESYKLTAPSPMLGAYLELSILAQAFYVTDAKYVFPTEIFNNLDK